MVKTRKQVGFILHCGLILSLFLGACATIGGKGYTGPKNSPRFNGMGEHHRVITTSSPKAQEYFDQGLIWAYAFNHDEAIRSFTEATRHDPECAMAWWGIALCNGPHINNPVVTPDRAQAAWTALQKALAYRGNCNATEQALIDALSKRYADPQPEDRYNLDKAYADAMRKLWQANRKDNDVGTLFAEALMDLRPWDMWTHNGKPQPGTEEVLAALEEVFELNPHNPGANHLYIHAVEASPNPERANAAADRLRNAVPTSGHLVHMPSHIDVKTGRWKQASIQNERAIKADRNYRKISPRQGFYRLYMAHNQHMLSFASMMEGRFETALRSATNVIEDIPEEDLKAQAVIMDPVMGARYDVLKRFGKWDEILSEPAPRDYLPYATAMWRFNRALAYAAKGQVSDAIKEKTTFAQVVVKVPKDRTLFINPARKVLRVAEHMLNGEIAYRKGDISESVAELKKAIAIEDDLLYMEPPEWVQPVRHTLGAILLSDGQYAEAERVYREDLEHWPNNGWSLYGLSRSLKGQGKMAEAEEVEKQLRKAWDRADTRLTTSCLCVPNV